ncbi:MAG: OB-fold nucleic acid binding domain-containing protein, partial [Pirellulaceae bacterium]
VNLKNCKRREEVIVGGMISSIKLAHTKNPKPGQPSKYANFDLEDVEGMVRCIVWPDDFAEFGHLIVADAVVLLRAVVDRRDGGDEINLIGNEVIPIAEADSRFTSGIRVFLDSQNHDEQTFVRLREILRGYPGSREVWLEFQ